MLTRGSNSSLTPFSTLLVSLERCFPKEKTVEMDFIMRERLLIGNIKKLVVNLLERNNLKRNDIRKFIPQNVYYLFYRLYAKSFNVKLEKFFLDNIAAGGHLGDVDSIRNRNLVGLRPYAPLMDRSRKFN